MSISHLLHVIKLPISPTIKVSSSTAISQPRSHSYLSLITMNKSLFAVFLCILTLAFSFSDNSPFSLASSMSDQLSGRRLLEKFSIPAVEPKRKHKIEGLGSRGGLDGEEHNDHDDEGLIFNADYRGVTTHPSPLPKHPRP